MTLKVHVAGLPLTSVAVQLTVVVPIGKQESDGGKHVITICAGSVQLSVAVGEKVTATHLLPFVVTLMSAGQTIVGGSASSTVTRNEQLGPADVVQVTVVVPTGKKEPEEGLQVTAPHSGVAVGSG